MLQEILQQEGYITLGVTGGGYMAGKFGFDRGFSKYDDKGDGIESEASALLDLLREYRSQEKCKRRSENRPQGGRLRPLVAEQN